jgi:hypothetical protein
MTRGAGWFSPPKALALKALSRCCAVTDFQLGAASESSRGNALPSNSSQTMSRGGFMVAPGQKIPQSVSVEFKGGIIFYYLVFSAAKGVVD